MEREGGREREMERWRGNKYSSAELENCFSIVLSEFLNSSVAH